LLKQIAIYAAKQPFVRKAIVTTPVVRDFAWRFVAGQNLDAGLDTIRSLNQAGVKGTLNHVGTHVHDQDVAKASTDEVVEALRRIANDQLDANMSIKLTQIGLDIDESLCRQHLDRILEAARQTNNFVRIDMEEAPYVDQTLNIFKDARDRFGSDTVGIVIQSYLRDHKDDLKQLVDGGSRVRLVKGGYWEPDTIVYRDKAEIDAAFLEDAQLLLTDGRRPALASHDAAFISQAQQFAQQIGREKKDFEFQMLFGVKSDLQEKVASEGHVVRVYVPYGEQWYEYFLGCMRRQLGAVLGGRRLISAG
jgi:proline dehydrogenase